ncbi:unnamed protein product [Leptosia nina]|uniref:Nuclear speckle splicing regulatory protein 1 N-terminal domain-containing protein n=1 Tax=Leptosia nina TaxID=320188 RepID=A0AAV1IS89_9NEOP
MSNKKQYGLILSEKAKPQLTFQASRNVFGNDSDSDDESKKKAIPLQQSDNSRRQAKKTQEKVALEDPTVYQYDEIYDTIVTQKESKKVKSKEEKKPKYIENLLKTANKRKIENERRIERQIQKEREQEGEEFADKEVFVTSAYKKKLEELRLEEEKEKYEEYLEKIGDVTKQRDLGGFYRHLYEQKLGSDKLVNENVNDSQKENETCGTEVKQIEVSTDGKTNSRKRNYRKRQSSCDMNVSGEIKNSDDEINTVTYSKKRTKQTEENIDADSDFSIDDSSDDEQKPNTVDPETTPEFKKPELISKNEDPVVEVPKTIIKEVKPKVDIWKKRTVGEVLENALKRFYERKAARGS